MGSEMCIRDSVGVYNISSFYKISEIRIISQKVRFGRIPKMEARCTPSWGLQQFRLPNISAYIFLCREPKNQILVQKSFLREAFLPTQHTANSGHCIDFGRMRVLDRENMWRKRVIKEAWWTKKLASNNKVLTFGFLKLLFNLFPATLKNSAVLYKLVIF